jgi:tRNA pseudouridine38-40 synthase
VIGMIVDAEVSVVGSGRTDAGVHAEGQVANVKIPGDKFTPEKFKNAINGNLWRDIRVMKCERVPDEFHARFSAKKKTYVYRIVNAPVMSPFWRRFAAHESKPLDLNRMTEASRLFLGEHDWTAFSSAQSDGENRVRNITDVDIRSVWDDRANGTIIECQITGTGFQRYMVRSIVGTMIEVAHGTRDVDSVQTAIVTGDRKLAGKTAPAQGLTLLRVEYD